MNNNNGVCEICGKKDPKLGVIWYGRLDGLRPVWACGECRKVDEYVKGGERGTGSEERRGTSSVSALRGRCDLPLKGKAYGVFLEG